MKNQAPKPLVEYPKLGDWVSLERGKEISLLFG